MAPFIYDVWYSPEVLARVSEVAGVELVPVFDFEVSNINVSINDQNMQLGVNENKVDDDRTSAVAWHYDSFPFVTVTMLSDCAGMVGGETALKKPSGEIMKIRGPTMV